MVFTPIDTTQRTTGPTPSFEPLDLDQSQQPVQPAPVKSTLGSALNTAKTFGMGALKGLASDAASIPKLMADTAPTQVANMVSPVPVPALPSLTKIPVIGKAFNAVETATRPEEGLESAGYNTEKVASLIAPFFGGAVAKAPQFANALEKASLRITPAVLRDLGSKVGDATQYLLDKGVTGSPADRVGKLNAIYSGMEDKLQLFLKTHNTAKGVAATRSLILKDLEALKSQYKNSRDYQSAARQIDDAKALFDKTGTFKREKIPIDRLNELKRSTFDGAYNKAGAKVLDEVEHSIGGVFNSHLQSATKGLSLEGKSIEEFNKEYGTVINARNLLKAAESRDEIGILGKIISTMVGGTVGGAVGGPVGGGIGILAGNQVAPIVAGTRARSTAAALANVIGKGSKTAKAVLPALLTNAVAAGRSLLPRE